MKTAAQCGISKYNISNPYTGAEGFKDCKNINMLNFLFEELKMLTINIKNINIDWISLINTNHFQISSANLLPLHFVLLACIVKITCTVFI